jgi:hypothetical protein
MPPAVQGHRPPDPAEHLFDLKRLRQERQFSRRTSIPLSPGMLMPGTMHPGRGVYRSRKSTPLGYGSVARPTDSQISRRRFRALGQSSTTATTGSMTHLYTNGLIPTIPALPASPSRTPSAPVPRRVLVQRTDPQS